MFPPNVRVMCTCRYDARMWCSAVFYFHVGYVFVCFWLLLFVESYCRPSSIERRARRVLKHAKIVPVRGIDSKEKAESFIREARWVMGIKDVTLDIGCAMQGLKAGAEVEPSWLMACVRDRECR